MTYSINMVSTFFLKQLYSWLLDLVIGHFFSAVEAVQTTRVSWCKSLKGNCY